MQDLGLYATVVGVQAPWTVDQVALVVDLDDIGMLADLDRATDEPGRHRVGAPPTRIVLLACCGKCVTTSSRISSMRSSKC